MSKLRSIVLALLIAITASVPLTLAVGVGTAAASSCTSASFQFDWQLIYYQSTLKTGRVQERAYFCYDSTHAWANTAYAPLPKFWRVSGSYPASTTLGYYTFYYYDGYGVRHAGVDFWVNMRVSSGPCGSDQNVYYWRIKAYQNGAYDRSGTTSSGQLTNLCDTRWQEVWRGA
jgi:hypothetical protein